ncbi:MAG: DUF1127 domain-containing protein [Rhodospirillales bacterium]|jgi:uncharacterized protein YjiS (DUF1127 family)|nr:DUF1127 domain-containing protein [Rhodospirillales bacterium]
MMAPYADKHILEIFTADMDSRAMTVREPISSRKGIFRRLVNAVAVWWSARKIEAELDMLSDHMLEDIGVNRGDIHTVAQDWAVREAHPANDDHVSKAA